MLTSFFILWAKGIWYPGPIGISALETLPPLEQSIKSTPTSFNHFAN